MAVRILFGGNFINKGAEAMAHTMVELLRKKYPNDEPVLLDLFPSKYGVELQKVPFRVVNMHVRTLFRLQFPLLKPLLKPTPKSAPEEEIARLWAQAKGFYDISGYGVSAHNQQPIWTLATIFPALWARHRNIPVYLMPQSLGPFHYTGWKKWILKPLVRKYLNVPQVIFIREAISRTYLKPFRTSGIEDSLDLVLLNPSVLPQIKEPTKAIALIPNKQITKFLPMAEVAQIFASLANQCSQNGYTIHLLAHASDDHSLNEAIYQLIEQKNNTIWYRDTLSVPETEALLAEMTGVITARYHGLVHALKAGKPCLVIGWAHKYEALLRTMELQEYYADCSNSEQMNGLPHLAHHWLETGIHHGAEIARKVSELQQTSRLFELI